MDITAIIVAGIALLGTILTPIIKDKLDKKNGMQATLERIEKKLDDHVSEQDEFNKSMLREEILTFARDVEIWKSGKGYNWVPKNEEMWNEYLHKIEQYNKLCKKTGDPNHQIKKAMNLIEETYEELTFD